MQPCRRTRVTTAPFAASPFSQPNAPHQPALSSSVPRRFPHQKVIGVERGNGEDLIPASAIGPTSEASTPTVEKSILPATRTHRQPRSDWTPRGTWASAQTMESSSAVRVIETKGPQVTQVQFPAMFQYKYKKLVF